MVSKIQKILVLLAVMCVSQLTYADDYSDEYTEEYESVGLYLGVAAGYSDIEVSNSDFSAQDGSLITGTDIDDQDETLSVYIGYEISQYLAIETGYINLGEIELTGNSDGTGNRWSGGSFESVIDVDGLFFALKGMLPIGNMLDLYGKLGVLSWDADFDSIGARPSVGEYSDEGQDFYIGLGASVAVDKVQFNLELDRYTVTDTDIFINVLSLGMELHL